MSKQSERKPLQVYLMPDLRKWLDDYAQRQDMSRSLVIRLLLERQRQVDEAAKNGRSIIESVAG